MRIGIDANPLLTDSPGGIEVYLAELTSRMPRISRNNEFLLYFNYLRNRNRAKVEQFTRNNVRARVCRIPPQILLPLQRWFHIPVDLITGIVDVMFYPSFVVLPQKKGRAVVTVHDLIPLTHPEFCEALQIREFRARVPISVKRADAVIVVSAYTGRLVQELFGISSDRIHYVPNGINGCFRPLEESEATEAALDRNGIKKPYFLFVGTMEPRKNLVRMVKAFGQAIRKAAKNYTLVLAGKPAWGIEKLHATIAQLPAGVKVILPGYISEKDLPALYSRATGFLFLSLVEGFGIPPLEAMACGCPVIVSKTPALCEVAGNAALTVEPENIDGIADGIRKLIENEKMREVLRKRGFKRAKMFSWELCAEKTLKVLEKVCSG